MTVGVPTIHVRRERIPTIAYARDERAALPRRAGTIDYVAIRAGAPEPYRSNLGANIFTSAFPYPQWVRSTGRMEHREFTLIDLENARWRVTICPDLGGRILSFFDKARGAETLWQSTAFRLASVGLPGAWLLGGIEFNAFRFGHHVHGMMAVRTERVRLDDGAEGLRIGSVDEMVGCAWSATLALDEQGLSVRLLMQNHTDQPQPGYWWTNIAVPMQLGTRLFYKPGPCIHHGIDLGMEYDTWPHLRGQDWQFWQNHDRIVSAYLMDYASPVFGYAPPGAGWALAHGTDSAICRGRKLWSVGAGHDSQVWMDRLGEPGTTSYCEIQCGRAPTQLEADLLAPRACREWTERFTIIPWDGAEPDAGRAFATFEQVAIGALPKRAVAVVSAEIIAEEEPRVALSRRAVLDPAAVDAATIVRTIESGWVAGAGWKSLLERAADTPWRRLALGALLSHDGEVVEAESHLREAAAGDTETAGFAHWLLGWQAQQAGRNADALEHYRKALRAIPNHVPLLTSLQPLWLEEGAVDEAARGWAALPSHELTSDAARFARAQIAFARGRWAVVREELSAPMPCVAEGSPAPWQLYRESLLAEALASPVEQALDLLRTACGFLPQFGVGRFENYWNVDLLYYRWRLARDSGHLQYASGLASHLLRQRPYVGSVEAAYLLRLAREMGHPSAAGLEQAARAWNADAGPGWEKWIPLRHGVLAWLFAGSDGGWQALARHPLYRHRAAFERSLCR